MNENREYKNENKNKNRNIKAENKIMIIEIKKASDLPNVGDITTETTLHLKGEKILEDGPIVEDMEMASVSFLIKQLSSLAFLFLHQPKTLNMILSMKLN